MSTLVLLRHGESEWNAQDRFTGWVDVDLTPFGEEQARTAGHLLREAGLKPSVVHTSALTRAVRTATILLQAAGWTDVLPRRNWRLNERHYGALQGREKRAVRAEYGDEQYRRWRRSYDGRPPPLESNTDGPPAATRSQVTAPAPRTESLADVLARLLPYWTGDIAPELRAGHTVLVVAHSNSIRALVAHLDALTRAEVTQVNIPIGVPLRFDLDADMQPMVRGGRYLDPVPASQAECHEVAHHDDDEKQPQRPNPAVGHGEVRMRGCLTAPHDGICDLPAHSLFRHAANDGGAAGRVVSAEGPGWCGSQVISREAGEGT